MTRPGLDAVLFDLGGVLTSDPWQSILLTPGTGVADQVGLPRDSVKEAASGIWSWIAVRESTEAEFWAALEQDLDATIPQDAVREAERRLLVPNRYARSILATARDAGVRMGVVSDNTSFWYPKQAALLGLDEFVEESMVFLSCREGVSKADSPDGLFDRARDSVELPSVVVDDRGSNLEVAEAIGFVGIEYRMGEPPEGLVQAILALASREAGE